MLPTKFDFDRAKAVEDLESCFTLYRWTYQGCHLPHQASLREREMGPWIQFFDGYLPTNAAWLQGKKTSFKVSLR